MMRAGDTYSKNGSMFMVIRTQMGRFALVKIVTRVALTPALTVEEMNETLKSYHPISRGELHI